MRAIMPCARTTGGSAARAATPAGRRQPVRVMADVLAGDDEEDVLGDVRGVVADPLEVTRHQHQLQRGGHARRRLGHRVGEAPEGLVAQGVEDVVPLEHGLGQADVAGDEGIDGPVQHRLGDFGHPRQHRLLADGAVIDVAARRLGDVHGEIADPLQVGVDLDRGDDDAQVDGYRLLQRQQFEGAIVDRHLAGVDVAVPDGHLVEGVQVAGGEAADGLRQARRDRRPLQRQLALELVDAGEEVASGRTHLAHGGDPSSRSGPSRSLR
jgi:hypothetical protein